MDTRSASPASYLWAHQYTTCWSYHLGASFHSVFRFAYDREQMSGTFGLKVKRVMQVVSRYLRRF